MKKKLLALLLALTSLFAFASADTETQLAWAMETTDILYKTSANDSYMAALVAAPEVIDLIAGWAVGDPAAPAAVYRMTFDMDFLAGMMFEPYGGLDESLPLRNERVIMAIPNMMIGQYGVICVAASSATRTSMAYVGDCGYEMWLIDYDQGGDVVVTFCPYDTGAVVVTASFSGGEIKAAELAKQIAAFNGTGLMSIEKVR